MLSAAAANIFSPSKNACMVRVPAMNGIMRYRNDPYRASVIPNVLISPLKLAPSTQPGRVTPVVIATPPTCAVSAAPLVTPAYSNAVAPKIAALVPEKDTVAVSSAEKPAINHYAVVEFKHSTAYFLAPFRVSVNDCVVVEGDRGEACGIVQEITTETPQFPVPCKILRRGTPKDKEAFSAVRHKEATVARQVSELAESLGMNMRIMDVEFQFDGNKLTVFYSSKGPVDFRKLQRSLFKQFRCRIWLVNWTEIHPSRGTSSATTPR